MLTGDGNKRCLGVILTFIGCLSAVAVARAGVAWQQQLKLTASDGEAYDYLGASVFCHGDQIIVGAPYDDDEADKSGSAYIFKFDGDTWKQQHKLTAWDATVGSQFGWSVSITSNYAIVGAPYDDVNGLGSGSAYIFKRDDDRWTPHAKLTAFDGISGGLFGISVCISSNYAAVGACYDDDNGQASGSVYVFNRRPTGWFYHAKLTPSDGDAYDCFGSSVAISGNCLVVGTPYDEDRGTDSGSAYIFERTGTDWLQQAKLTASDGQVSDYFGSSVSIDGGQIIVGAFGSDDGWIRNCGSAYIFERPPDGWVDATETVKLTAADSDDYDEFGKSVSISADRAVVGADYDDDRGEQSGSIYILEQDATGWHQKVKLTASDGHSHDRLGFSVSVSGDYAIAGAYGDDDHGNSSGSAYLFAKVRPDADLNGNYCVDFEDFALFALHWLQADCGQVDWCRATDLNHNSSVDGADFAIFAQHWGRTDCSGPNWCDDADINHSGQVDWADLAVLAGRWLHTGCGLGWCRGADLNRDTEVRWSDLNTFTTNWLQCNE